MRLLLPLALLFALAQAAAAQAPADARAALSTLPDSQAVLYINARRIINEVMPSVMPPAEYQKMLAEAQNVGLDVRGVESVAVGARFADPPPANNLPEFVVVVRGNFNAHTLLALGRVVAGSQNIQPRSETYGSKTLDVIDMTTVGAKPPANGEAPEKSKLSPYPEIAVTALDANTLVAGVPSYVKAMVDAAGGRGALRSSMVDLAARDPQALWSLTVELPPNTVDYLRKTGMPINAEAEQMIRWVKQVSLAQGMDALNYSLSASVLTDAPEHASAFSGLVRMGLLAAQAGLNQQAAKQTPKHKDYARTRTALNAVKTFVNRTEGNTLVLSASVPQKELAAIIREETADKPVLAKVVPLPRKSIREVETDQPSFVDTPIVINGVLELSTYYNYGYAQSQLSHYAFELKDQTGRAHVYMPKDGPAAAEVRRQLLAAGGSLRGTFMIVIRRDKYQPSAGSIIAELVQASPPDPSGSNRRSAPRNTGRRGRARRR